MCMREKLQEYVDRCLALNMPIIIDGVRCECSGEDLVATSIEELVIEEEGVYKFPDCITAMRFDTDDYTHFIHECVVKQVSILDFNDIVWLDISVVKGTTVRDELYITELYADNWNKVYDLTFMQIIGKVSINNVKVAIFGSSYEHTRSIYAKNAGSVVIGQLRDLEECFFEHAEEISGKYIEGSVALRTFYAPSVYKMIGRFKGCAQLQSVVMNNLEEIPNEFLSCCFLLKHVSFVRATMVGYDAFKGCHSLTRVSLPSVETLSNGAFMHCDKLEKVELPKLRDLSYSQFTHSYALRELVISKNTYIRCKSSDMQFRFRVKMIKV